MENILPHETGPHVAQHSLAPESAVDSKTTQPEGGRGRDGRPPSRSRSRSRSRDRRPSKRRSPSRSRSPAGRHRSGDRRRSRSRSRSGGRDRDREYRRSRSRDRYERTSGGPSGGYVSSYGGRGGRGGGDGGRYDDRRGGSGGGPEDRYRAPQRPYDNRGGFTGGRGPNGRPGPAQSGKSKEEMELLELTRDARTVFVSQLVVKATENDVRTYFQQVGPVSGVVLIRDKHSGKSKGYGYVELEDLESVPKALMLHGQKFCSKHPACTCSGFPLSIKPSEAEKNYAAQAEAQGGSSMSAGIEKRVYLCNLDPRVTEGELRPVVSVIGAVEKVHLVRDERGQSRGYGYVQFSQPDAADAAIQSLHGFELANRKVHAGRLNAMGAVVSPDGQEFPLDDGAGHALTAQARAALISQLSSATSVAVHQLGVGLAAAAAATASSMPQAPAAPVLTHTPPTTCVLLSNLFSPAEETAEGITEISDDVAAECARFGKVAHWKLDPVHQAGLAWVMFTEVESAATAMSALSGRAFGGRVISAEFVPLPQYLSRYPEAVHAV